MQGNRVGAGGNGHQPLAATLYQEEETKRLNLVHAYWPFGLIVGRLIRLGIGQLNLSWQFKLAVAIPSRRFPWL